jgi:DNA-binding XRE family transcriptional regulator
MGFKTFTLDDYEITEDGKVYNKKWKRYVKPQPNGAGYLRVHIAGKMYFVHRLVAEKYVPNPENKPQVNHKDGNHLNNQANNLEWVTNRENSIHALENGLMMIEEKHPMAKLTREDVAYIKSHPEMSRNNLAKMFNVNPHTITDIRKGKTWKTVEKIC